MTELLEIALCSMGMVSGGAMIGAALMDQHHKRVQAVRDAERRRAESREEAIRRDQAEQALDLRNTRARLVEMNKARAVDESYAQGVNDGMQMGANATAASECMSVIESGGRGAAFMRRRAR